jgi:hypothetical protein
MVTFPIYLQTSWQWQRSGIHLMADRKQRGEGTWDRYNLQRHTSSDLLPLTRLYLIKFPEPSKIWSPAKDQVFNK